MRGLRRALNVLVASLAAFAGALPAHGQTGFTCCNFHHSGDWISDANWIIHPRIPAGTPARILEYGEHRVSVEIGGRAMTLGLDYGRRQNLREWAQRMIVTDDPKPKIASWPAAVREAIESGRVAVGMTKEQVIVAVGYPPAHATPSLEQPQWKYWYDTHGTYEVAWEGGRVKSLSAPGPIRFRVLAADPVEGQSSSTTAAASGPVQLKDLEGLLPAAGQVVLAARSSAPAAGGAAAPASSTAAPGLPTAGTQWVYSFAERMYSRREVEITVRVLRVDNTLIEEALSGATQARRVVDASRAAFTDLPIRSGISLVELAPYLLAASQGKPPADIAGLAGYPLGSKGLPDWIAQAEVQGWEQVAVPAGTFKALRVDARGRRSAEIGSQVDFAGKFHLTVWYAPEIRRFVRLEHRVWSQFRLDPKLIGHDIVELVSFRPS